MLARQSITHTLLTQRLISPPPFLPSCVHYETEVGSVAYGVATSSSDIDIYGFCVPPKEMIFHHLAGEIPGFGRQKQRFEQFMQHGIKDPDGEHIWDLTIYSIVRYFALCMEANPNMLESLFTPDRCVRTQSTIAQRVRQSRHVFLHKGSWHKFKGFAYSQLHKMQNKEPEGKRLAIVERHGYDVKFAYHAIRLMSEAEQILTTGDLTLDAHVEELSAIRRGEWSQEDVMDRFRTKEAELEEVYKQCTLIPHSPNEDAIRTLLLECLEEAWGDLHGVFGT